MNELYAVTPDLLDSLSDIARGAGERIMAIYNSAGSIEATEKQDQSPLTLADQAAHTYIVEALQQFSTLPIISEEAPLVDFEQRRHWPCYWLIDPLDGTKEFIDRNGEFTVNIALVVGAKPVVGVVYAPVNRSLYRAINTREHCFAQRQQGDKGDSQWEQLKVRDLRDVLASGSTIQLLGSRHHGRDALATIVARLQDHFSDVELRSLGSSLKFCHIAAGEADAYLRLGPTSEWDTAAAQVIVEAAGGYVLNPQLQSLTYNQKVSIINPAFSVLANQPGEAQGDNSLLLWFRLLREYYTESN